MDTLQHLIAHYGYGGLFLLLMLGVVGPPVPDETLLAFAGYLVYRGDLLLAPTLLSGFLGSACGITLSYLIGSTSGYFLITRYGSKAHIGPEKVRRVHDWFERRGRWTLAIGYYVPGVRHLTALVAGAAKLEYPVFAAFAYLGALVWSGTFVLLGYFMGEEWNRVSGNWHWVVPIAVALAGSGAILWTNRRRR